MFTLASHARVPIPPNRHLASLFHRFSANCQLYHAVVQHRWFGHLNWKLQFSFQFPLDLDTCRVTSCSIRGRLLAHPRQIQARVSSANISRDSSRWVKLSDQCQEIDADLPQGEITTLARWEIQLAEIFQSGTRRICSQS